MFAWWNIWLSKIAPHNSNCGMGWVFIGATRDLAYSKVIVKFWKESIGFFILHHHILIHFLHRIHVIPKLLSLSPEVRGIVWFETLAWLDCMLSNWLHRVFESSSSHWRKLDHRVRMKSLHFMMIGLRNPKRS